MENLKADLCEIFNFMYYNQNYDTTNTQSKSFSVTLRFYVQFLRFLSLILLRFYIRFVSLPIQRYRM